MTEEKDVERCEYKFEGHRICERPVMSGQDQCIFHGEKTSANEVSDFSNLLREKYASGDFDCRGLRFPAGIRALPKDRLSYSHFDFRHAKFAGDALFDGVCVDGDIKLQDAKVSGVMTFAHAYVKGDVICSSGFPEEDGRIGGRVEVGTHVTFRSAEICGMVALTGAVIGRHALFDNAKRLGDLALNHAQIGGKLSCADAIIGSVNCEAATLCGEATFRRTIVDRVMRLTDLTVQRLELCDAEIGENLWLNSKTRTTIVRGAADFQRVTVRRNVAIVGAEFHGEALFMNADFRGRVWFNNAQFAAGPDFHAASVPRAAYFDGVGVPTGQGASLYNFAKRTCRNMGMDEDASQYHYLERLEIWRHGNPLCSRAVEKVVAKIVQLEIWERIGESWLRSALMWPLGLFELIALRGACGYFEKPWRIAGVAIGLILLFGCVYWTGGLVGPDAEQASGLFDSMYFSVVTFTTLGLGDLRPLPDFARFARFLIGLEALTGAFLVAAFIVTLARRWGRG
jgi:hypothetical protein